VSGSIAATVSLRWIRPFIRITGADPLHLPILQREGITVHELVNPDTRISHLALMEMLEGTLARTGNPRLGLLAGEAIEPGDMDVLEYAARSCATLREAIQCANRYMVLMHGGQQASLREEGDYAVWELRNIDDVVRPPASNDFALTAACTFARRYTGVRSPLHQVHFQHDAPSDRAAYARVFDGAATLFGMPCNALVFAREQLELPMLQANAGFKAAFELHAEALLERLKRSEGVSGRARELIIELLRSGEVSMEQIARRMAMSVATLRRRLAQEGTSHSELLDAVRRELAEMYLADMTISISEVTFLLGFSRVAGFYRAFGRWYKDETPAEYRERARRRLSITPPR
jgi:AraC-like DNA-binding protein